MLNFKKNLKKNENAGGTNTNVSANRNAGDLRQRLLQKEFDSLKQLPVGCQIQFDNPDVLHLFKLT